MSKGPLLLKPVYCYTRHRHIRNLLYIFISNRLQAKFFEVDGNLLCILLMFYRIKISDINKHFVLTLKVTLDKQLQYIPRFGL